MTDDEILDLLSVITAYDKRTTGEGELNAWAEAARRGRWTMREAVEAVHEHYATSTDWLMPGHVTVRIKAERPAPSPRELTTGSGGSEQHRRRIVGWARKHMQPASRDHQAALSVPCPHCGAAADRPCVQTTGPYGTHQARSPPIAVPHIHRRHAWRAQNR